MQKLLTINNLHVRVEDTQILNGVSLEIPSGQTHAIMGPNGSGKSTLALTLMGHPSYKITDGSVEFDGQDLLSLSVEDRAKAGLFLAFQSPCDIEGLSVREFLYNVTNVTDVKKFESVLAQKLELLSIDPAFVDRHLNVGFSGGEKKVAEILQLAMLQPKLAILDEIDSGLDVDALKKVCACLNRLKETMPELTLIVITHYPRILHYLIPDRVHVVQEGVIRQSGDKELAQQIERSGYSQ